MLNKLKSTYTILNNALELSKPEYGTDVNEWYLPEGDTYNKTRANYFLNTYLKPHLKVVKTVSSTGSDKIYLANGVMISVSIPNSGENIQASRAEVYIYLEPTKKNNYRRNLFLVELGGGAGGTGLNRNKFLPYGYSNNGNRNIYLNGCAGKRTDSEKQFCLALIFYDGWQIKDDYPW